MRDYASGDYCDFLWINDLLLLKKSTEGEYSTALTWKRGQRKIAVTIKNVTVFGAIVEIKQIGDRGILYSIDDGTGVICCKHADRSSRELCDIIQAERGDILNETFASRSSLNVSSWFDNTLGGGDDTVFNDKSLQEDDAAAVKRNTLKALHSIWCDIEDSFSSMVDVLNIGDTVLVEGRLYTYFDANQIHVNNIRPVDMREEMMLVQVKLEDGCDPIFRDSCKDRALSRIRVVLNQRRSGLMTFDNVPHMDREDVSPLTCLVVRDSPRRGEGERRRRKRRSIVQPHLQGTMTFDTFPGLDDSGPGNSINANPDEGDDDGLVL